MHRLNVRVALLAAAALLAVSGCNGNNAVPSAPSAVNPVSNADTNSAPDTDTTADSNSETGSPGSAGALVSPDDTTSILKKDKKDIVIGSTVDPHNGDQGPRALAYVDTSFQKLKNGSLLVCNFSNKSGTAGAGTTIEQIPATEHAKPTTFVQSNSIKGCDGVVLSQSGSVYATALAGPAISVISADGKFGKHIKFAGGLGSGQAPQVNMYSGDLIFAGSLKTGEVGDVSANTYGKHKLTQGIGGFPVNKGSGFGALGPSGFTSYAIKKGSMKVQTAYILDGACNALVAISSPDNILQTNEITVNADCTSFHCKHPAATCATLVKSGSPLDAPVAVTILPNGNFIVANTTGNTLVELTPTGQVLATRKVDKHKTPGIFALAAIGKTDDDTRIFFTDSNVNSVHELAP